VALTHALAAVVAARDAQLIALHLNHGLRGSDADRDEAFCRALCKQLNVPVRTARVDVRAVAAGERLSLEDAARKCRFRWFAAMAGACQAQAVFLAHHADDQAETVLLRLLRGAGVHGLAGMRVESHFRGMRVVRPWLAVRRSAIEAYLRAHGLRSRIDASNRDVAHDRNWVRHTLLPLLAEHGGGDMVPRLTRTAQVCRRIDTYVAGRAAQKWRECGRESLLGLHVACESFQALEPAVQSALVKHMLAELGLASRDLNHAAIDSVRDCAASSRKPAGTLPHGLQAFVAYRQLYLGAGRPTRVKPQLLEPGVPAWVTTWCQLELTPVEQQGEPLSDNGEAWRDVCLGERGVIMEQYASLPENAAVAVRQRHAGDRYRPVNGMERKVKDLLIDAGVPQVLKQSIPLVTVDDRPAWLAGWRIAEEVKVRRGMGVWRLRARVWQGDNTEFRRQESEHPTLDT
jgi:tRNA(Ile)-lysidine synthase